MSGLKTSYSSSGSLNVTLALSSGFLTYIEDIPLSYG